MPVGMLQEIEGLDAETYDAVNEAMDVENNRPEGLIFHTAGPMDGGWRIFDVWESREAFERFNESRVGPAIAKVMQARGEAVPTSPPEAKIYELHNLVTR